MQFDTVSRSDKIDKMDNILKNFLNEALQVPKPYDSSNLSVDSIVSGIFFVGFSICVYKIVLEESNSKFYSLLVTTAFYFLPVFTNRISELRAYPMELLGTALSVYLLLIFKEKLSYRRILVLLIIQLIFCTSRYGYVVVAFCVSLRILFLLYRQNTVWRFVAKAFLYSIPLLSMVIIIYFGMMKYQSSEGSVISYAGYILNDPKLLISPMSLLLYCITYLSVYLYKKKQFRSETVIFSLMVGYSFFILSILGLFPWDLHRTISAFFLIMIGLIICVLDCVKESKFVKMISMIGLCALFGVFVVFFDKIHNKDTDVVINEFVQFVNKNAFDKMLVQVHMTPVIKYQYEYGLFKENQKKDGYPERFVLQIGETHNKHTSDAPIPDVAFDVVWSTDGDVLPSRCEIIQGYQHFYHAEK